jgi:hypothetical protein
MVRMHHVFLYNFLILLFVQMMCIVHESMTFHAAALHGPSSFLPHIYRLLVCLGVKRSN